MSATVPAHERPHVAHHFENLEQQRDALTFGMWVFLGSEVLFFGGLFAAYAVVRSSAPDAFATASRQISAVIGAVNTAVLLTSSLTMALAVYAAHSARRQMLMLCLALTMVLGASFIGIKMWEWHHEYEERLVPGKEFLVTAEGTPRLLAGKDGEERAVPRDTAHGMQMFFLFYFIITGLHALHMLIGLAVLGTQLALVARSSFGIVDYTPIELAGLYWHFVDIVWIFVFPLLYLLRHS